MKFEKIQVSNFEGALRGMRNPKNSWDKSDSFFGLINLNYGDDEVYEVAANWALADGCQFGTEEFDEVEESYENWLINNGTLIYDNNNDIAQLAYIGPNDMRLAKALITAGPEHRKFMRQIFVSVDITAPLYWWKEFDTYKVGTVANSTSTMHKILSKPITLDCFEIDDLHLMEYPEEFQREDLRYPIDKDFVQTALIPYLEFLRKRTVLLMQNNPEESKRYWKELIRWLPEAWLQKRTVTMNYENLLAICSKSQRRFHKLTEWSGYGPTFETPSFIKFAKSLPYAADFLFLDDDRA